jgi:hypothetical protein
VRRWWTLAALFGLAGCGNDQWVEMPLTDCYQLELNRKDLELVAPGFCDQTGGLTFGEKFRCKDDKLEVLCRKP